MSPRARCNVDGNHRTAGPNAETTVRASPSAPSSDARPGREDEGTGSDEVRPATERGQHARSVRDEERGEGVSDTAREVPAHLFDG